MRVAFRILSYLLLVFGAFTTPFGLLALFFAKAGPIHPPPSIDEGPGLASLLGWIIVTAGLVSALVGFAIRAALRAKPDAELDREWAREHKRL